MFMNKFINKPKGKEFVIAEGKPKTRLIAFVKRIERQLKRERQFGYVWHTNFWQLQLDFLEIYLPTRAEGQFIMTKFYITECKGR